MPAPVACPAVLAAGDPVGPVLVWIAVLIGAVLAAGILLFWLRRRLDPRAELERESPLDLATLRRLHRDGELTDEQFEAARAAVIRELGGDDSAPHPHAAALRPRDRRAEPGYDLTGEPLPPTVPGPEDPDPGAGDDARGA